MRLFTTILLIVASIACGAQNVDIDEQTQNKVLAIQKKTLLPEIAENNFLGMEFVDIGDRIPAYGLYNELWDNDHLRSFLIEIPFSEGSLKIILLESRNKPFVFPCRGNLTLPYGKTKKNVLHTGIDFSLQENDPIYACFDGVVRMAREYGDYGKIVVIRHYNGLETVYSHLSKVRVRENQVVKAGYIIGFAGKTGNTQEVLLHFETRFLNGHFNPAQMINLETRSLHSNTLILTPADFSILPTSAPIPKKEENNSEKQQTLAPATDTGTMPAIILSTTPQSSSQENQKNENAKYHIVQKGENLYRLAIYYGTTVEELMLLNDIKNADQIQAGQKLIVK